MTITQIDYKTLQWRDIKMEFSPELIQECRWNQMARDGVEQLLKGRRKWQRMNKIKLIFSEKGSN
jgi:hypothetical protein